MDFKRKSSLSSEDSSTSVHTPKIVRKKSPRPKKGNKGIQKKSPQSQTDHNQSSPETSSRSTQGRGLTTSQYKLRANEYTAAAFQSLQNASTEQKHDVEIHEIPKPRRSPRFLRLPSQDSSVAYENQTALAANSGVRPNIDLESKDKPSLTLSHKPDKKPQTFPTSFSEDTFIQPMSTEWNTTSMSTPDALSSGMSSPSKSPLAGRTQSAYNLFQTAPSSSTSSGRVSSIASTPTDTNRSSSPADTYSSTTATDPQLSRSNTDSLLFKKPDPLDSPTEHSLSASLASTTSNCEELICSVENLENCDIYHVCIVGAAGVGKKSLAKHSPNVEIETDLRVAKANAAYNLETENYILQGTDKTEGQIGNRHTYSLGQTDFKVVMCWMEPEECLNSSLLHRNQVGLYIFMYDQSDVQTIEPITRLVGKIRESIKSNGGRILLLGNKSDLPSDQNMDLTAVMDAFQEGFSPEHVKHSVISTTSASDIDSKVWLPILKFRVDWKKQNNSNICGCLNDCKKRCPKRKEFKKSSGNNEGHSSDGDSEFSKSRTTSEDEASAAEEDINEDETKLHELVDDFNIDLP